MDVHQTILRYVLSGILIARSITLPATSNKIADKPNIIIISIDDMNDWVYSLGDQSRLIAPTFDSLMRHAVFFKEAYTNAPLCNPSRVSMLTGLYPSSSHIFDNTQVPFRNYLPNAMTIIDYFKLHGYTTLGLGKLLHLEDTENEDWDYYSNDNKRPNPPKKPANGVPDISPYFDWAGVDKPISEWGEYKRFNRAIEIINQQTEPFIMTIGTALPHGPWYIPEQYVNRIRGIKIDVNTQFSYDSGIPATYQGSHGTYSLIAAAGAIEDAALHYAAAIGFIDDLLGRFLAQFKTTDHWENTLIVIFSDHGWHLGEKQRWGKGTLWNESEKVPLIFAGNQIQPEEWQVDQRVELIDVYPTLNALAGLPSYSMLQGQNIKEGTDGVAITWQAENEFSYVKNQNKFIHYESYEDDLYDLENAPEELSNLWKTLNEQDQDSIWSLVTEFLESQTLHFETEAITNSYFLNDSLHWTPNSIDRFEIEIALDKNFNEVVYREKLFDNKLNVKGLLYLNTDYYARIRAVNPKNKGEWSSLVKFQYNDGRSFYEDIIIGPLPNPVTSQLRFYIHNKANLGFDLAISDLKGNYIYRETSKTTNNYSFIELDFDAFPPGVYVISAVLKSGSKQTKKVLKIATIE